MFYKIIRIFLYQVLRNILYYIPHLQDKIFIDKI
jgi:hypothetical protein